MFACWSTRLVILASLLLPPANLGQAQEKKVTVPLAGCGKRDDATQNLFPFRDSVTDRGASAASADRRRILFQTRRTDFGLGLRRLNQ